MAQDWQDSLRALMGNMPAEETDAAPTPAEEEKKVQTARLDIIVERKGRGGKVATIISGFTVDDEQVAEIAANLKRRLGAGGSSRGGEILIQGERARDVLNALTALGLKARII